MGITTAVRRRKRQRQSSSENPVAPEAYRSLGFPGAEDLGNMFQLNADFAPDDARRRG